MICFLECRSAKAAVLCTEGERERGGGVEGLTLFLKPKPFLLISCGGYLLLPTGPQLRLQAHSRPTAVRPAAVLAAGQGLQSVASLQHGPSKAAREASGCSHCVS
jgi:hypothetical protein